MGQGVIENRRNRQKQEYESIAGVAEEILSFLLLINTIPSPQKGNGLFQTVESFSVDKTTLTVLPAKSC